jgi:hypothetical protein
VYVRRVYPTVAGANPSLSVSVSDVGARRYRRFVIVKRVTRVALTRTTEPSRNDLTSHPGTELRRVERTNVRNGKADELAQSHYTEAAARRHVDGLLAQRIAGVSIDSVYSESL